MTAQRTRNPWIAIVTLSAGVFMTLLDLTIVNIAIPDLIDGLHASLDEVLWVTNSYIIVFAVVLVPAGRLGDIYGPRALFVAGTAVFTAASALCGLAGTPGLLIAARALQGLGAALMTPQAFAFVVALFAPERRGAAFGVNGITAGVATASGPVLGGLLVYAFDWRAVFFVNVPVGIVAVVLTLWLVPDVRRGVRHRLDLPGVAILSAALVALTFGLIEGQRYDWGTVVSFVSIPLLLAVGVALLGVFALAERRRRRAALEPLVPARLFESRGFALMTVVGAANLMARIGVYFAFVIYLQSVLGLSPLKAGLVLLPASLVAMVASPVVGWLADRWGGKYLLLAGLTLFAATTATLLATSGASSDPWVFVPTFAVSGVATGLIFTPMNQIALLDVDPRLAGAGAGVLQTARRLGSVIGVAAVGAVLQNRLAAALVDEAARGARDLPAAARAPFVHALTRTAGGGLDVGRHGAQAYTPPPGTGHALAAQLSQAAADAFRAAFTIAMHWSLVLPIVVAAGAALLCLALRDTRGRRAPEGADVALHGDT